MRKPETSAYEFLVIFVLDLCDDTINSFFHRIRIGRVLSPVKRLQTPNQIYEVMLCIQ